MTDTSQPESILEEAQRIIHGARNASYGHPRDNFQNIADLFNGYLAGRRDRPIDTMDVANLMILVKVARLNGTGYHRDSVTDIAGYAGTIERLQEPVEAPLADWERELLADRTPTPETEEGRELPNSWRLGADGLREVQFINEYAPEDITVLRGPDGAIWRRTVDLPYWVCDEPDRVVNESWTGWFTEVPQPRQWASPAEIPEGVVARESGGSPQYLRSVGGILQVSSFLEDGWIDVEPYMRDFLAPFTEVL